MNDLVLDIPHDAIVTYTGEVIRPLDPDPKRIHIEDIAHHLSNTCRFTGAVRRYYSVAEHSVHVSRLLDHTPHWALWGLLHDAPEAFLNDLARPVKHVGNGLGKIYRQYEAALEKAIAERFGLSPVIPPAVKKADDMLLVVEGAELMPKNFRSGIDTPSLPDVHLFCWHPEQAEDQFLNRYAELAQKTGGQA